MGTKATEIRKGNVLDIDGDLWLVVTREHIAPGNWRAINHFKLKNLMNGNTKALRCGSGEMLEVAFMEKRKAQYLYQDGTTKSYVFMDLKNYEQYELNEDVLKDAMKFVVEQQEVDLTFHGERAISIDLPGSVAMKVTESEPAIKGNTVSNLFKRAVVETGLEVKVPLHIDVGEMIKVSTETGEFQGRSKE
ncbi:MAG: elongation factor P [Planctomycetota bacterium]